MPSRPRSSRSRFQPLQLQELFPIAPPPPTRCSSCHSRVDRRGEYGCAGALPQNRELARLPPHRRVREASAEAFGEEPSLPIDGPAVTDPREGVTCRDPL